MRARVERRAQEIETPGGKIRRVYYYEVLAYCCEDDLPLIIHHPPPTIREQVKMCWGRGINPRVYCPFLPHGYEGKVGLDFFGNDLPGYHEAEDDHGATTTRREG